MKSLKYAFISNSFWFFSITFILFLLTFSNTKNRNQMETNSIRIEIKSKKRNNGKICIIFVFPPIFILDIYFDFSVEFSFVISLMTLLKWVFSIYLLDFKDWNVFLV